MSEQIPRTDICEECEREIVPEVDHVDGQHDLIHQARTADEGFMAVTGGSVTVTFACLCSRVQVEYGPGSASAWDIPDEWMWEDEVDSDIDRGTDHD